MNKKYVLQAFELNLKGRFDVLLRYYGQDLFAVPAQIMSAQIKDELGIDVSEQSIYTLKKRLKKTKVLSIDPLIGVPAFSGSDTKKTIGLSPDQDLGTIVENATKETKGKKDAGFDLSDF